ncbi:histone acetylation protein-domain-containing protein [Gymnopilus junonius]|uniref:histone acetyltransferase n=1 Tax=Gymnopilus junonius TaxID=109634 RepID=A0A9P5NWB0_GYMJU|nr:histone acetylation protein-domain-containing protein [Gymnopilus junonius]
MKTNNLRDHLLAALAVLPGTREFHLHTLVSAPRKSNSLFPFAKPKPPRVYVQDILLILSEQASPDAPRIIVSAVEACVYMNPTTSCAVFYVSKVDSTGQAMKPSPTATLVRALIEWYVNPKTRPVDADHVWVQLFARAQAQYLFPNSNEWSGKEPLSDTKLCAWWKRLLTRVAEGVEGLATTEGEKEKMKLKLYYVLPGYNETEAEHALRIASSSLPETNTRLQWVYGHPYSQSEIPLPCPPDTSEEKIKNLGHLIPYFEDDPKSRFMDEIAYTTDGEIRSPVRKRARTMNGATEDKGPPVSTNNTTEDGKPLGELGKVTADEFWERMSFRQECVAGAVTGFFTMMVSWRKEGRSGELPLAPETGQVAGQVHKRVMTTLLTGVEFSTVERAAKGTETVESAIRGLCEGIASRERARTPERRLLAPPQTPPRTQRTAMEISPNPFPEPAASLGIYLSHIYGSVGTRNAVEERKTEGPQVVQVLHVRRRNKAVPL